MQSMKNATNKPAWPRRRAVESLYTGLQSLVTQSQPYIMNPFDYVDHFRNRRLRLYMYVHFLGFLTFLYHDIGLFQGSMSYQNQVCSLTNLEFTIPIRLYRYD